tara:strand:+ start:485 stop:1318 length:834 start_codon:yes stop_codon:yes gene_type:complete
MTKVVVFVKKAGSGKLVLKKRTGKSTQQVFTYTATNDSDPLTHVKHCLGLAHLEWDPDAPKDVQGILRGRSYERWIARFAYTTDDTTSSPRVNCMDMDEFHKRFSNAHFGRRQRVLQAAGWLTSTTKWLMLDAIPLSWAMVDVGSVQGVPIRIARVEESNDSNRIAWHGLGYSDRPVWISSNSWDQLNFPIGDSTAWTDADKTRALTVIQTCVKDEICFCGGDGCLFKECNDNLHGCSSFQYEDPHEKDLQCHNKIPNEMWDALNIKPPAKRTRLSD